MAPPTISIALAAARQAAAIGAQPRNPPQQAQSADAATARPVTPAKPAGTGLLIDKRI